MYEGWPALVEALEEHGRDLSLPEGVDSPLDIFPVDLRHRLWLQVCFDALSGLGQGEELSLEKQPHRVKWFVRSLKEHKDTVQYFDLTLEKLLTRVIMPPKDEKLFVEMVMEKLGMTLPQERLARAFSKSGSQQPMALRASKEHAAKKSKASGMKRKPSKRSSPMTALRNAAIAWGKRPLRTCDRSSPKVTSRT